jgi:hypothetical protein
VPTLTLFKSNIAFRSIFTGIQKSFCKSASSVLQVPLGQVRALILPTALLCVDQYDARDGRFIVASHATGVSQRKMQAVCDTERYKYKTVRHF